MQNSNQTLGNKFDNQVMQIPKLKTWMRFDRFYFHAKSKVKSLKYHKVKFHTSFKSCGHAESKILDLKQF